MLDADTLLQDRYRIISHIGKGGMGSVYLARDENLGTTVAVKQNFFAEQRLIEAFKREARLLAGLRHQALPQVKDYFIDLTGQYLVMEYIPGDDLGTILEKRCQESGASPFDIEEVLHWAEQLLDTLDYLHSLPEPVIHRDIKPQNLKLAERNQIILLDFGLAKGKPLWMSRVTTTGSIHGYTPNFAPIEQIRGLGTDPRSDLYGLGATLYYLITGVPPVDAATRADAFLGGEPDPLRPANQVNPKVPQGISELLMKAMEQHRNNRPPSAAEMLKLVRAAKHSTVIDWQPPWEEMEEPSPVPHAAQQDREKQETETLMAADVETQELSDQEMRAAQETSRRRHQQEQMAKEAAKAQDRMEAKLRAAQEAERLKGQLEQERRAKEDADRERQGEEQLRDRQEERARMRRGIMAGQPGSRKFLMIAFSLVIVVSAVWAAIKIFNSRDKPSASSQSAQAIAQAADGQALIPAALKPGTFTTLRKVYKVSLSDDGRILASAGDEPVVRLWQQSGAGELAGHTQRGRSVAMSRDGQTVVSGSQDGTIRLWRASDGQLISSWNAHPYYVFSVGFSPDGKTLFSAGADKTIKLWRVSDSGLVKPVNKPGGGYLIVTVSPDVRLVGFYHQDGPFKLWSLMEDNLVRELDGIVPMVSCGAFSNDGQMLALGSEDGAVQVWRVSDGRMERALGKFNESVASLAFSADGKTLAAGLEHGAIKLWRVSDGGLINTLEGHTGQVNSLAFSVDGRTLASGSDDMTIRVWSIGEK